MTQKKRTGQSKELGLIRDRQLHIRLDEDEFSKLEEQAKLKRTSVAKYCRDSLLYGNSQIAKTNNIEHVKLLNELHKIGVNLNQLAHRANKGEALANLVDDFIDNFKAFKALKKSQRTREVNNAS
ncbi:MAG: plasmid mobilization relaxosome protein MobC [Hydrogenophaga sp.]|uniref:plasmid mobilization protein n=1 Tax=Hydrogenophaga sp. TaxID=1904254 RepID=UPI00272590C1|nr:plasmid mobilization relaxosome protein MobC [Hydrogenophaga sp.]MDO9482338.1 plasmid mobilization relaxosome protein MobC [Hydrogenophaga sp.]MDP3348519.1 plasmid mobilization relaxosome protein MobC [Hydrogenophaga sp.]MDP3806918.1 plasmid mobilization relaxosome protein MobC [Hydrogenophaga sp.]MDP3927097.1 plasmid mobilization relaxosome protein MobC [Hydrogenophaga sp.]